MISGISGVVVVNVLALGRSFRSLGKANMSELLRVMPMAVQDLADEWFTFEPLKAAIGSAAVRDIQQGPRSGGTTFVLLHYLTGVPNGSLRGRPWLPPTDGSDTVIALAEQAARQHKVAIRTGAEVERIRVRDDATTGVVLVGGEEIAAPMVLSTLDPARTLLRLVDPVWLDPEFLLAVKNIKFRGATAMIYYGLDALPFEHGSGVERSLTGVVSLSNSLDAIEKAYDAAKYGGVSEHPHVEITMPSLLRPRDGGRHVLVAKAQYVPHTLRDNAPWDAAKSSALGDAVTAAISRLIPRFNNVVVERVVLTPRDLEQTFGLTGGAVTMGEMTLDQILFMRPVAGWGQYATPITGLYLGGPGTHPGPGVFGASGLLAAKRMLADSRKRK